MSTNHHSHGVDASSSIEKYSSNNTSNSGSSGLTGYSPISTLERQYRIAPNFISVECQRLVIFVTAVNCCIPGGVATLLNNESTGTSVGEGGERGTGFGEGMQQYVVPAEASSFNTATSSAALSDNPFALVEEENQPFDNDPTRSSMSASRKSSNSRSVSSLFKRAVKGATTSLERGIHNLAIKADQGRRKDMLTVGLYDPTSGALLSLSESQEIIPNDASAVAGTNGTFFAIPLIVPASQETISVKLWMRSGASLLQSAKVARNFLVGVVTFSRTAILNSMRGQRLPYLFVSHKIQTSFLPLAAAAASLNFLISPDSKFPPLCGGGWSLVDPVVVSPYHPLFNLPLDQSYSWCSHTTSPGFPQQVFQTKLQLARVVAIERSIESTIVLPVAAAVTRLASLACQQSREHAHSVWAQMQSTSTESSIGRGDHIDVHIQVFGIHLSDLSLSDMINSTALPPLVSTSWQRPDSILEKMLNRPTSVPTGTSMANTSKSGSVITPPINIRFFPKPCTSNALPSLTLRRGGPDQLTPLGYLIGSVRFEVILRIPKTSTAVTSTTETVVAIPGNRIHTPSVIHHNPFDPVVTSSIRHQVVYDQVVVDTVIDLEDLLSGSINQTGDWPLINSRTGQIVGTLAASIMLVRESPTTNHPNGTAPASATVTSVSPNEGLVSWVGLPPLCSTPPDLDFVQLNPHAIQDPAAQRVHAQLLTMGSFISSEYLSQHLIIRDSEAAQLNERAAAYRSALTDALSSDATTSNAADVTKLLSHQDKSPKPFRPSSSRSTKLLSGIPFNVHTATVSVMIADPKATAAMDLPPGDVLYNTTCGAPADHARDFSNVFATTGNNGTNTFPSSIGAVSGGLRRLESKRQDLAYSIAELQLQLTSLIGNYFAIARQQSKGRRSSTHVPVDCPGLQDLKTRLTDCVQAFHHVTWICACRRASVFSQALGIALTTYLGSLSDSGKIHSDLPELWARHGYLISYEGLLSAAGKELGMIEDAYVGIAMLRMVQVVIIRDDGKSETCRTPVPASPYIRWIDISTSGQYASRQFMLQIGMIPSYFDQRVPPALRNNVPVRLYSLLFEVGVDIRQWGANAGSSAMSQLEEQRRGIFTSSEKNSDTAFDEATYTLASFTPLVIGDTDDDGGEDFGAQDDDVLVQLNYDGFRLLNSYSYLFFPTSAPTTMQNKIHPLLEKLHQHIVGSSGKMDHSILDEAAALVRQLGGGAAVFCKSGKDRTAMHVTYKQAQFIHQYRKVSSKTDGSMSGMPLVNGKETDTETILKLVNLLRTYGTRLPICEKNVGQAKYAFNSLQVKFMPETLKPPMNTLAGFLKGGKVLTGGIES